jgi:predicted nucleotidyltransferase
MIDKIRQIKNANDRLDKIMIFTAVLTRELKQYGIKPVLVGGGALEFYTQGNYTTLDVDLVIAGRDEAKKVLAKMGFSRAPGVKSWYSEELELSVEIPDETLAGSMERLTVVELDEDLTVYVIGLEDLIIDRLNAYKWWKSLSDGEWATATMAIHFDDIDYKYLKMRAKEEMIEDVLNEITDRAKKVAD